jgi:putative transposase
VPIAEVCRKFGITETTFYRWKKRFSSMMPSEIMRLKQLKDENKRLKTIVADLALDKTMLQDVLRKEDRSLPAVKGG